MAQLNGRQRRQAKQAARGVGDAQQPEGATTAKPKAKVTDERLADFEPIVLQIGDGFTVTLNPHAFKAPEGYKLGSIGWGAFGVRGQIDGRDVVATLQVVCSNSKVK